MIHRAWACLVPLFLLSNLALAQSNEGAFAGVSLELKGWTPLGLFGASPADRISAYYRVPATQPPGSFRRLWVREELSRRGPSGVQSFMMLIDADCSQARFRTIQYFAYKINNLSGDVISSDSSVEDWTYPGPGSLGESFQRVVCGAQ
jgi:hypothetical protein